MIEILFLNIILFMFSVKTAFPLILNFDILVTGYIEAFSSIFYFVGGFMLGFIGLEVRVFANGPGDLGSNPDRVIPKTQKMVLDASLLNTQHYKVRITGKVELSRERSSALPYTLVY